MNRKTLIVLICLGLALTMALAGCSGQKEEKEPEPPKEEQIEEEKESKEKEETEEDKDAGKEENKVNIDNVSVNTQSSIKIAGSKTVYCDPYKISDKAEDADILLITHAHYDHFDAPSIKNVVKDGTIVVCPKSMKDDVDSVLQNTGKEYMLNTMENGEVYIPTERSEDIAVFAIPAYNVDKSFHKKEYGWLGYVLTLDDINYYIAGDTDVIPEQESDALSAVDVAFLPIGGTYTMDAKEAAGLTKELAPKYAVPVHYGSIVGSAGDFDTFSKAVGQDSGIQVVAKVADAK